MSDEQLTETARKWAQKIEKDLGYSAAGGPQTIVAYYKLLDGFELEQCEALAKVIREGFPSKVMVEFEARPLADYILRQRGRYGVTLRMPPSNKLAGSNRPDPYRGREDLMNTTMSPATVAALKRIQTLREVIRKTGLQTTTKQFEVLMGLSDDDVLEVAERMQAKAEVSQ